MKRFLPLFAALLFHLAVNGENQYFRFSTLPALPPNMGYTVQPGLAGVYTGIDDDVLLVAGGANFPGAVPWEGGIKQFYDEIFVLRKDAGSYIWSRSSVKIPYAAAYGGAIETPGGLLCFGGNGADEVISQSWLIDYRPETGEVEIKPGPQLPVSLTNFAFAKVDGFIYIAGGISENGGASGNHFFRMQISGNAPSGWQWEALPPWDGPPRAFAVGIGQSNGAHNCFYLFSGRTVEPGKEIKILFDAHVYDPIFKTWTVISEGQQEEFPVMAGTVFAVGAATIIFPSGAGGKIITQDLNHHPGFGNKLIAFNTITKETYVAGQLPSTGQVTTTAVKWGSDYLIPTGEIRPGVRTPEIVKITVDKSARHLGIFDYTVIGLYFLILSWMGYFFSKRQKTTNDYFKGGGRIPWWAAGLSIFGTALSAITFMAIPAKTFATDWSYFMLNMTIFLVAPVIVFVFIPFYRKMNITTAYEYLEVRFNLAVRLIGSLSFILFQVGRMGVILFLPSIALNLVSGIDIFLCIGLMGVISLVYTMIGGIEAVIWTDVMQVVVLLGGALLSLALIIHSIDGGFSSIIETAVNNQKFNIIDFTWSLKQPTVWVMLLGGFFTSIITYGTDQTMVQRYLTTKTEKAAQKSVWTNAILTVPATLIFFFTGTALFVFFKAYPGELNPTFANNDAIFPWYIASQLPAGVSGLLIAGIFAAAMSSLSSSMNSAATAWSTDIHFRFKLTKGVSELTVARIATLVIGVIGIVFALFMATMDVKSLWDEFQKILGLVIGSLGGVFLLGILTKRANATGALIGIVFSIVVQVLVAWQEPVHLIVYSATGVVACFVGGIGGSFIGQEGRGQKAKGKAEGKLSIK
jgi:solute:Na+ symporter, SSS family